MYKRDKINPYSKESFKKINTAIINMEINKLILLLFNEILKKTVGRKEIFINK
jgi:hypothetical protein